MSRKMTRIRLLSLFVMILVMACATISTAVPQQPVSTTDPQRFSSMVAATADSFMTQTAESGPVPSSPTATIPPPTRTPIPTATSTPVEAQSGTSLGQLEDGSIQFVDHVTGIRLNFPAGWLVVRLNESEYFQAWEDWADDPIMLWGLGSIQTLDPGTFRVVGLNTGEKFVFDGGLSQINIVFNRDDIRTLEQIAEAEKNSRPYNDFEMLASNYKIRPDGLEMLVIEEQWQGTTSTDAQVMQYFKSVCFKVPAGTVAVDLYTAADIKDNVLPEFDRMVEQMQLFTP